MAQTIIDQIMLREPRLLTPGNQPLGPVKIDKTTLIGQSCKRLFVAFRGLQNDVASNIPITKNSGVSVIQDKHKTVILASSGYMTAPVSSVPSTFVLAIKFKITSTAAARIIHLTKDTGLTTIAGLRLESNVLVGQNYDGGNDQTPYITLNTGMYYTVFFGIQSGTNMFIAAYNDIGVKVGETSVACTWTAGPNRFTWGFADWSSGEWFNGSLEWAAYFEGWTAWLLQSVLVNDPYHLLVPA